MTLPSDCREVQHLYFDDGVREGPIDLTSPERLAVLKGTTQRFDGYPRVAAVTLDGTRLLLSPKPDQAYVVRLIYVTKLTALGPGDASANWLLLNHSDIYLYATLVQSAPFLKDDERIATWQSFLDRGLTELQALRDRQKFPGRLVVKPRRAIG